VTDAVCSGLALSMWSVMLLNGKGSLSSVILMRRNYAIAVHTSLTQSRASWKHSMVRRWLADKTACPLPTKATSREQVNRCEACEGRHRTVVQIALDQRQ
jgi:hypothetical protein